MNILSCFDSGKALPYKIDGNVITFDLKEDYVLNVIVDDAPECLKVNCLLDANAKRHLIGQGLIISTDDVNYRSVPFEQVDDETYSVFLNSIPKRIRIATHYPYGRDSLDQLLCDTYNTPYASVRMLKGEYRSVPVFEFGTDDGKKTVHYIVAGEDTWETAGTYAADGMIRFLCENKAFAKKVLEDCVIRIIPLASPYSAANAQFNSYVTLAGEGIYGAATWGEDNPPS